MKKTGKRSIWISIVVATMLLTGCGNQTGSADRATGSDAIESVPSTTEVVEITTEEVTTEVVIEAAVSGSEKPEAVPATTEIGGGKKKAEETTEEQKPSVSGSGHSNSGNASNGQSTTPKPSNSGNSGNSGSSNSGGSSTPSSKPSTPATTEAPTTQHQHNYNVWVKTKDAWNETVIDTPEQTIDYPEQGYYVDTMACHTCGRVFTSLDSFIAHATYGGGSCSADGYGSADPIWVKTRDPYTETIPAKTHTVHHAEEGYWKCECGARK